MTTTSTLRVDHVAKTFGHGRAAVEAVREVSLEIAPGEVVLIMGPSGSGKTTLLSMMGALLRPSRGDVYVNGTAVSQLPESKLPALRLHRFGFIFQDFNLLSALSAIENVALVAEIAGVSAREAQARAGAMLGGLGLGERMAFLPEQLSGGEKQRVAIARALMNDPAVILADEPTANLDSRIGHEIMRLLQRIARDENRSVVIVSHDDRLRDIADRVLWLEDGALKDLVRMSTDPVCGMSVDRQRAFPLERDGSTMYFCSRGCRAEYLSVHRPGLLTRVLHRVPGSAKRSHLSD